MDLETLDLLAREGFASVPAHRLGDLAAWCDDWGIATGEARYSVIAEVLLEIDERWGEQGVPQQVVEEVERSFREYLTAAVNATDAREGAYFAGKLREEVRSLPWTVEAWKAEGLVERPHGRPN